MALTQDEIDDIVGYFTTKNSARSAALNSGRFTPRTSTSTWKARQATKAATTRPKVDISKPDNAPFNLANTVNDIINGIPIVGPIAQALNPTFGKDVTNDIFEPMEENEAPKNTSQWIMNLLGTGAYASAGAAEEIGRHLSDSEKRQKRIDSGELNPNILETVGHNLAGLATPITGAARGVAEGFGARFDRDGDGKTERPRTWQQNFEAVGVNDAIRENAENFGATEDGAHFFDNTGTQVAIAGLAGDILLDPLSWITAGGTGALAASRAATRATGQSLRAKEGLVTALGRASEAGRSAQLKALDDYRIIRENKKLNRAERRAAKGQPAASMADQRLAEAGGVSADDVARAADETLPGEPLTPAAAVETPTGPLAAADEAVAAADPRLAAVDELLPNLRTKGRDVPAEEILGQAVVGGAAKLDEGTVGAITTAMRANITDKDGAAVFKAAIAQAKESPAGATFLATKLGKGNDALTVEGAIRQAGRLDDPASHPAWTALQRTLERAVKPGKAQMTAGSLEDAIRGLLPDIGDDLDAPSAYQQLLTAKKADRPDILRQILGAGGDTFKTFDDAIRASVDGQVEASMMRSMLNALGVATKAATATGLAKALGTRGQLAWDELKASIPTPREVLDRHGIDIPTEQAAKAVDVEDMQASARAAADEADLEADAIDAKYGVNFAEGTVDEALPNPAVGGGSSMRAIMAELDEITPHTVEIKNEREWYQLHSAVMRNGRVRAANTARVGGGTGLRGAERGDYLYEWALAKLRAGENYQRSLGKMPYLIQKAGQRPLYVSFGQMIEALPEGVVKLTLFDLDYRLSKFGEGATDAARDAQSHGLSVLPTTFANGVTAAMKKGATAETITKAMLNGRQKHLGAGFERTKTGEKAIEALGKAMAEPGFADEMLALHEAQEVVAVAFMQKAADEILAPFAARFMDAVIQHGDRSTVISAIKALKDEIPTISPGLDSSLVRAIVEQRSTNGILNALGRAGTALARADARAAARTGNKSVEAQTEKMLEVVAAKKSGAKSTKSAATVAKENQATRTAAAQEERAYLDDTVEDVDDLIAADLEAGVREPTDLATVEGLVEHTKDMGVYQIFSRLGRAFIGDFGMEHLKPLQAALTSGSHALSHDFEQAMRLFGVGGKAGRAFMFGGKRGRIVGADKILGDDLKLGRAATDVELNQHLGLWANTLAKHAERLSAKHKRPPLKDELKIALLAGSKGVDPLSEAQADLAMNFMEYIDEVFAPIDGPLARGGIATDDAIGELKRYGIPDDALPKADESLAGNAMLWMGIDWTAVEAPLDLLGKWHKAMAAAQVPKTLAAQASHLFDHRSGKLYPAMTAEQARAKNWQRVNPLSEGSRLAKYFDPESYFPPEFIDEIRYADNLLDQLEKSIFGAKEGAQILRKHVVAPGDFVIHILKSLNTIWNPAHHVGNMLGENAMLLVAGVNPMYQVRAYRVLRAGGRLAHLDDDPLSIYRANFRQVDEMTPEYSDKWFGAGSGSTRVNIGGKMVDITPEELWQEALTRGVAITPQDSKDMVYGNEFGSVLGRSWVRSAQAVNPYTHGDRALGEISATRDNFTRIGHFMSVLENGRYRSLEDALAAATKEVHDFHPTVQTLSAFDQKYTRRVIFFHTWVRKAADIVVRTAMERPALISAASKAQYNAAEAQGFEPESFGAPFGPDDRIADYYREGLLGPTFTSGYSPLGGTDELIDGEEPHLWGMSLSLPQIDALQALFGGVPLGKDPISTGAAGLQAITDNLNPMIKAPGVAIDAVNSGEDATAALGDHLASSSGMPYRLAGAAGLRPKFDLEKAANEEDRAQKRAWNDGEAARTLFNWLSGLKAIDYTNETSRKSAERTRSAWEIKTLGDLGYSDPQVKAIRKLWKEQRLTTDE